MEAEALVHGIHPHLLHARTELEIEDAFFAFRQQRCEVLVIGTDAFFNDTSRLPARSASPCRHRSSPAQMN
jgi:hypothetical protein